MRYLLSLSVAITVGSIIESIHAVSEVSRTHQLASRHIIERDQHLDIADEQFLDLVQDSYRSETSSEFYKRTILPRGNCLGKPCVSEPGQQPRRTDNQATVTDKSHSSDESELRRITPPWPSLPRASGHDRSVSRDKSPRRSPPLSRPSSRGGSIPGSQLRLGADSNRSPSRSPSRASSASSNDDINDPNTNVFPSWVRQPSSNDRNRSSISRRIKPLEISAIMKGPGAMFARKGIEAEWSDGSPGSANVYKAQSGQIVQKQWSHRSQMTATFVTGKGGCVNVQACGPFVKGNPRSIATDLPTVLRKPGRATLQSWRPPLNKEMRQIPGSIPGKKATFVFPHNLDPEMPRGVIASSAGHPSGYQAGLSASAEGRMLLEIEAQKHDDYWPDAKKSYAHRWVDVDGMVLGRSRGSSE